MKALEKNTIVEVNINNVPVKAIVLDVIEISTSKDQIMITYIMYGQNRLFRMTSLETLSIYADEDGHTTKEITCTNPIYDGIITEYCEIPEYDFYIK